MCRAVLGEGDGLPRLLPRLQRPEVRLPGQEQSSAAAIILEWFCEQTLVILGHGEEFAERDGAN